MLHTTSIYFNFLLIWLTMSTFREWLISIRTSILHSAGFAYIRIVIKFCGNFICICQIRCNSIPLKVCVTAQNIFLFVQWTKGKKYHLSNFNRNVIEISPPCNVHWTRVHYKEVSAYWIPHQLPCDTYNTNMQ